MLIETSMGPSSIRRSKWSTIQPVISPIAMPPAVSQTQRYQAAGNGGYTFLNENSGSELESQEPRRVIDEALTFEDVNDAAGKSYTPGDGSCGDGVGGSDNCSEHQTEPPIETGEDAGRCQSDADHGEGNQSEGKERDADDVVSKVAPGGRPGGRVEQRRQYDKKNQVRVERNVGNRRRQS